MKNTLSKLSARRSLASRMLLDAVLAAYVEQLHFSGRTGVLIESGLYHASCALLNPLKNLNLSFQEVCPDAHGRITAGQLTTLLKPRTGLVIVPWADALTGVIHPIEEIAELCQNQDVLLHLDLSAAYRGLVFAPEELSADLCFMTLQPPFAAFLERTGMEGEETDAIWKELHQLEARRDEQFFQVTQLRDQFEKEVSLIEGVKLLFPETERLNYLSAIAVDGIHAKLLHYHLALENITANPIGHSALSFDFFEGWDEEKLHFCIDTLHTLVPHLRRYGAYL